MILLSNTNDDNHARNDNGDINYTVLVKLLKSARWAGWPVIQIKIQGDQGSFGKVRVGWWTKCMVRACLFALLFFCVPVYSCLRCFFVDRTSRYTVAAPRWAFQTRASTALTLDPNVSKFILALSQCNNQRAFEPRPKMRQSRSAFIQNFFQPWAQMPWSLNQQQ